MGIGYCVFLLRYFLWRPYMDSLRALGKLKNFHFFVPSYQRGYRWRDQEVGDLLGIFGILNKILKGQSFIVSNP